MLDGSLCMIYTTLFLGLPLIGMVLYREILHAMSAACVALPPRVPLFFVFAAYGAVLLFIVSECCREWSGMHSLALVGLFVIGLPWLLVQGLLWRRTWAISVYHRATIVLSFAFPLALVLLIMFAFVVGQ